MKTESMRNGDGNSASWGDNFRERTRNGSDGGVGTGNPADGR